MKFFFGPRSLLKMRGVHPDLVEVMKLAIKNSSIDLIILEGVRPYDRQVELVNRGASQTLDSLHLVQEDGWGHALDVAPYINRRASWHWPHYHRIAPVIKGAAAELGVPIEWGGDWNSFKDGPHWQLPRKIFPHA